MERLSEIKPEARTQDALNSISSHLLIKSTELGDTIQAHDADHRAVIAESMVDHLADVIESMASLDEQKLVRALNKVTEDVLKTTKEFSL